VASNGEEALSRARAVPPEVAVLDAMMPTMDAQTLLTTWMHDVALTHIPVVLISAAPALAALAQQFNVRATLAKPFDHDVLVAVIEQVLAHPEPPPDAPSVPAI
jgi:CheY-like chemotaxis protein